MLSVDWPRYSPTPYVLYTTEWWIGASISVSGDIYCDDVRIILKLSWILSFGYLRLSVETVMLAGRDKQVKSTSTKSNNSNESSDHDTFFNVLIS
jgi:hypothetical protein